MSGVRLQVTDGMAELRLDNPAKLNCFTVDMLAQMAGHLETIEARDDIRAVVVTGEG
jgi:enoyl-CoA hydratase